MEKPEIEPANPDLQGIALIHYTFFVAFLGIYQFRLVGLRSVLVFITGIPKGSPKVVFKEKPGIGPATPGLQGIVLIHYTTAASQSYGYLCKLYTKSIKLCISYMLYTQVSVSVR